MNLNGETHHRLDGAFAALRKQYTEKPPARIEVLLREQIRSRRLRRARRWSVAAVAAAVMLAVAVASRYRYVTSPASGSSGAVLRGSVPGPSVPAVATQTELRAQPVRLAGRRHSRKTIMPARRPVNAGAEDAAVTPFVAIPYGEPLAPSEQVDVYRVQLPRTSLTVYGLPAPAGTLNVPVTADVAVGSNGVVRAVRFVR